MSATTMQRKRSRGLWRKDFSQVSPAVRRAARYALQIVARCPTIQARLHDDTFLGQLWLLAQPLVDPAMLARLRAGWNRSESEDEPEWRSGRSPFLFHYDPDPLLDGVPGQRMRIDLIRHFTAIPDSMLAALAEADSFAPTHPASRCWPNAQVWTTSKPEFSTSSKKKTPSNTFPAFCAKPGARAYVVTPLTLRQRWRCRRPACCSASGRRRRS